MRVTFLTAAVAGASFLFPLMPVLGQTALEITKEKILAAGHEWQEKYDQYDPPADMIEALKTKLGGDVRIDVYLGLWCPDSRDNVPPFIKIMDRVGNVVPVRYFDVPKKANKEVPYFAEEFKVQRVPTFIFYQGGKEIGRIVETPKTGVIEDMMEIFFR